MNRRVRIESLWGYEAVYCTVDTEQEVGTKSIYVVQYREQERLGRSRKGWAAEKDRMDYRQKRLNKLKREIRQWTGQALGQTGEVSL
jgi:hypothetical protein